MKGNKKKRLNPFGITKKIWGEFFLVFAIFILILFIFENSFITPAVIISPFGFYPFLTLHTLGVALILSYLILGEHRIQFRIEILTIIALCGMILVNVIVLINIPGVLIEKVTLTSGEVWFFQVELTMTELFRSFLLSIDAALLIYVMLFVFPKRQNALPISYLVAFTFMVIGYVLIIHSLITEMNCYISTIKEGPHPYQNVPQGLFVNRNLFASYLFGCLLAVFYLWAMRKKFRWLYMLLTIPFAIVILFTISKTKIIMVAVLYLAWIVYGIISLYRRHKFFFWFLLSLLVLTITAIVIFRFVPSLKETPIGEFLQKLIPKQIFVTRSVDGRKTIWRYAANYLSNPFYLFFGRGFYVSKMLLGYAMSYEPDVPFAYHWGNFHNGFLEVISTGGIFLSIIYVGFIAYLVYVIIRIAKFNRQLAFYSFVALGVFLIHSSFEAVSLLLFNAEGIIHALPVVLPCLIYYNRLKQQNRLQSRWELKYQSSHLQHS
ncbi:MAG: O-antigen ligase family protein [Bacilli bacterium]